MQSSSVEDTDQARDQHNAESAEQIDPFFPAESPEFDSRAKRVLKELGRLRDSRTHNRPMLLDDLKELGMAEELSEDSERVCHHVVRGLSSPRYDHENGGTHSE